MKKIIYIACFAFIATTGYSQKVLSSFGEIKDLGVSTLQDTITVANPGTGNAFEVNAASIGKFISIGKSTGTDVTITLTNTNDVLFPIGSLVNFHRKGDGLVSFVGNSVTILSADSAFSLRATNSVATIIKVAATTWLLFGDIE